MWLEIESHTKHTATKLASTHPPYGKEESFRSCRRWCRVQTRYDKGQERLSAMTSKSGKVVDLEEDASTVRDACV